jgi:leucyl aminopeptidase
MPVSDYYRDLVRPKHCDLTNSSGKTEGGACQAAAFLHVNII